MRRVHSRRLANKVTVKQAYRPTLGERVEKQLTTSTIRGKSRMTIADLCDTCAHEVYVPRHMMKLRRFGFKFICRGCVEKRGGFEGFPWKKEKLIFGSYIRQYSIFYYAPYENA